MSEVHRKAPEAAAPRLLNAYWRAARPAQRVFRNLGQYQALSPWCEPASFARRSRALPQLASANNQDRLMCLRPLRSPASPAVYLFAALLPILTSACCELVVIVCNPQHDGLGSSLFHGVSFPHLSDANARGNRPTFGALRGESSTLDVKFTTTYIGELTTTLSRGTSFRFQH